MRTGRMGGVTMSDVETVSVLKGTNIEAGKSLTLFSECRPSQGDAYLLFATDLQGTNCFSLDRYRVVPLGAFFNTKLITGKNLDEQINILLQYRLDHLKRELEKGQEEKQRLETRVGGPLASAYEMAAFIDQVRDFSLSLETPARDHLSGLQAIFFISDYVMAAKTNRSLVMTKPAIISAFKNFSSNSSGVSDRLRLWVERPGTLSDHYRSIRENPAEKENIVAIEDILKQNGIPIDTESDLLMDCIRYVVQNTDFNEAYGPNPQQTPATHSPDALNVLRGTSDRVFRHRFETKFGLEPKTVTGLMFQLKQLRIHDLSPADVEIPAHLR
jgi:hypothetical protein